MEDVLELIREYLAALETQVHKNFSDWPEVQPAVGDSEWEDNLFEWSHAIRSGEVPAVFGKLPIEKAQVEIPDRLYYAQLVQMLHSDIQRGLAGVQEAAQLRPSPREQANARRLQAQGRNDDAVELEQRLLHRVAESARQYEQAVVDLLDGLRLTLGLLSGMKLADLVRGRKSLLQSRLAASATKYSRGIQHATNEAYQPGMTEQQCWDRLTEYDGVEVSVGRSTFRIVADGPKLLYQVNLTTEVERSIRRASFSRYFARARDRRASD